MPNQESPQLNIDKIMQKVRNEITKLIKIGIRTATMFIYFLFHLFEVLGIDLEPLIVKKAMQTNKNLGGYANFVSTDIMYYQKNTSINLSEECRRKIICGLYTNILGREAETAGLNHWLDEWNAGMDLETIAAQIINSDEYRSKNTLQLLLEQLNQSVTTIAQELLANSPITIVDIGAQMLEGEDHIYSDILFHGLPYRIIGFEPLEHRRQERLIQDTDKSLLLLPDIIGDGEEYHFHINDPDSTSSLLPFNRDIMDRFAGLQELKTVRSETVRTTPIDSALKNEPYIDLLKLDIQGFELHALQHATEILKRTLVVHCEVSFMEIYQNQPLFSEVELFMRGMGFGLMDFSHMCRYPFNGTLFDNSADWLGWGDAVFFRQLDGACDWRSRMVQSLLALVIYHKPSLAGWLSRGLSNTPAQIYANAFDHPNQRQEK